MAKSKTPSFVLTLKLNTNHRDEAELQKRFFAAFLMRNRLVSHARKRLRGLRQDARYRSLMDSRGPLAGRDDPASKRKRNEINDALSAIRREYGLSEYQFHEWMAVQKNKARGIDIHVAQKIASGVWRAVESVLFRKGKTVHFQRLDAALSVEGKSNASGIRFRDGRAHWLGLSMQAQVRSGDAYAREALSHKVKYCRIVRRPMGTRYHYYLQLVLEGLPPEKHRFLPSGLVGIDQGTSTEAVVSANGCILTELAPDRKDISREAARIQRRMDRSRRATNPDNYNPDGTAKRGRKFVRSRAYREDRMRLKALSRRAADHARQSAECLANAVLCLHGSDIITEPMAYRGLQARAKETTISEKTGRFRRKKRFGASIGRHAPARFLSILERKLGYMGKSVQYVGHSFRASQYSHETGACVQVPLGARTKTINGRLVQRDLYSAFLLMNAAGPDQPDREHCIWNFDTFLKHHDTVINTLLREEKKHPSCMGLREFRNHAS